MIDNKYRMAMPALGKICLWAGTLLLLFAIIGNLWLYQIGVSVPRGHLPLGVLPDVVAHWEVEDLPLAGTGAMLAFVEKELGYDDYVYRQYERPGGFFSVYIAYWGPGRRHFFDVGTHAPDNCWVQNGWILVSKPPPVVLASLRPAQARIFENERRRFSVFYWHLSGGVSIDYARYGRGRTMGFLFDNLRWSFVGRDEQYFIRIASDIPEDVLRSDPGFICVLEAMYNQLPSIRAVAHATGI